MASGSEDAKTRKYPFAKLHIADHIILDGIVGRHICVRCNRSRKFFCYNCHIPVGDLASILPQVELPVYVDIIKHKKEIDGKSTAVHAAILAPQRVRMYTYPEIPDYSQERDVVLIFPSAQCLTVAQLFDRNVRLRTENNFGMPKGHNMGTMLRKRLDEIIDGEEKSHNPGSENQKPAYTYGNLPVRRAVFIDSTWNQSRSIYADPRVHSLRPVVLQNRLSQFWRHQRGSPRWYMATIEAIHQFLLELHVNAWGLNTHYEGLRHLEINDGFHKIAQLIDADPTNMALEAPYNGQYDNLMFFFANMYDLIHKYYDHNELISYRRPV